MDIIPQDFDDLVEDNGCRVRITPSIVCPRRTGSDGTVEVGDSNHDLNCPLCFGSMVVDLDAVAYEDWAFIQGIKLERSWDPNSRFDIKDAMMTVRRNARIGYWFKVEVIDFGSLFNQLILRGEGDTDKLRYISTETFDGAFYALKDNDGNDFVRDVDYSVTGKILTWLTSNRPVPAKLYSFIFPVLPTFRVMETLHDNRYYYDGFRKPRKIPQQMPQQAHIRWDYLASKEGSDVSA